MLDAIYYIICLLTNLQRDIILSSFDCQSLSLSKHFITKLTALFRRVHLVQCLQQFAWKLASICDPFRIGHALLRCRAEWIYRPTAAAFTAPGSTKDSSRLLLTTATKVPGQCTRGVWVIFILSRVCLSFALKCARWSIKCWLFLLKSTSWMRELCEQSCCLWLGLTPFLHSQRLIIIHMVEL